MRIAVTYAPYLSQWFEDVAIATWKAMNEIGYHAELIPTKSLDDFNESKHDLIFVIAPHGFHENPNMPKDFSKNPNKIYACWDLEQTPFHDQINDTTARRYQRTLEYYNKYDFFFTESESKTKYFLAQGYKAHTLNFGYHPHYTKQIDAEKEFDLFFVGIMFPRRAAILNALIGAGLRLYPATNNLFDPLLKAKAIRSSKICLNIHHNEMNYFEKPRIIQDIMANGGFCVTETIAHPEGFIHGHQFIMATYDALVPTVLDWVKRPPADREQIAKNALNYLIMEHTASRFIADALVCSK